MANFLAVLLIFVIFPNSVFAVESCERNLVKATDDEFGLYTHPDELQANASLEAASLMAKSLNVVSDFADSTGRRVSESSKRLAFILGPITKSGFLQVSLIEVLRYKKFGLKDIPTFFSNAKFIKGNAELHRIVELLVDHLLTQLTVEGEIELTKPSTMEKFAKLTNLSVEDFSVFIRTFRNFLREPGSTPNSITEGILELLVSDELNLGLNITSVRRIPLLRGFWFKTDSDESYFYTGRRSADSLNHDLYLFENGYFGGAPRGVPAAREMRFKEMKL